MRDISVLLIEDNCDDEWLALRTLEKIGFNRVTVARDGMTALTMLFGSDESGERETCRPDLILLDLRLPRIDGIELLKKIRSDERTRDIKVFVLTSSEDPRDKDICTELGVPAFFSKPLDEKAVLNLKLL